MDTREKQEQHQHREMAAAQRELDWTWFLESGSGLRILHEILFDECKIDTLSFLPGCDMPMQTAFNEGRRATGMCILKTAETLNPNVRQAMRKAMGE